MTLRFSLNLSLLWADLPLSERFARAAAAGFDAVELWWPGDEEAARLPGLTQRWGLHLALLNFDAGDMPAGDRGLAADPERTAQLRANVPLALRIAADCGCPRLNLLAGLRDERYPLDQQLQLARDNVAWAADQAAAAGRQVMIEAVNSMENGPCLLTTTAAAAAFRPDRPGQCPAAVRRLPHAADGRRSHHHAGYLLAADQPHPDRGRPRPR